MAPVKTRIERLDRFWLAEGYHQKYYLRQHAALMREFAAAGYGDAQFVESRIAARLNGFVAGQGTAALLSEELPRYGLSPEGQMALRKIVSAARGIGCG